MDGFHPRATPHGCGLLTVNRMNLIGPADTLTVSRARSITPELPTTAAGVHVRRSPLTCTATTASFGRNGLSGTCIH
jgi:hypothetical protein